MFYAVNPLRTIAQETASQIARRNCSQEVREVLGYTGIFAEKQTNKQKTVVAHPKITANYKNRHLGLMVLVLFIYGKIKQLGLTEIAP